MTPEEFDSLLDEAWRSARSRGVIGESAVQIREHAAGYIPAAWRVEAPEQIVDLGSGAGVPGIHLADFLPSTRLVLVDSSARRCDLAETAVGAVGLGERVSVVHGRIDELARTEEWRESSDGAVARLVGPPWELAECGLALVSVGGRMVVSVNAETKRWWEGAPLVGLGSDHEASWLASAGSFLSIRKMATCPDGLPRRAPARRRRPWPDV